MRRLLLAALLLWPLTAQGALRRVAAPQLDRTDQAALNVNFDTINQDLAQVVRKGSKEATPVGAMELWGGAAAPTGWLLCQGQAISRTTYAQLYNVLGTTYGTGDGSTTFNLPDFRGVFPKGAGTTDRAAGKDASGNFYAATLGAYATDMMQGHHHSNKRGGSVGTDQVNTTNVGAIGSGPMTEATGADIGANDLFIWDPYTDGTNGTPRTGHTTEPQSVGVNFIIFTGI